MWELFVVQFLVDDVPVECDLFHQFAELECVSERSEGLAYVVITGPEFTAVSHRGVESQVDGAEVVACFALLEIERCGESELHVAAFEEVA